MTQRVGGDTSGLLTQVMKTSRPASPGAGDIVPIRINLSRQFGAGLETVAVRLAVANLGRPMHAFDLAFYRYWEQNHPGETLEEYLRRHTLFRRFSSRDSLRGQMESGLEDIAQALTLPGTIGSLAARAYARRLAADSIAAGDATARERTIANVADLVAPGGPLLVIARAREESDDPGRMPWALTRAEIESFPLPPRIEDLFDDEDRPVRRWRVEFRRPAGS